MRNNATKRPAQKLAFSEMLSSPYLFAIVVLQDARIGKEEDQGAKM